MATNHQLLLGHYSDEFFRLKGSRPLVIWGRDGKMAKMLLEGRELSEAKWLVTEFLERPPDFYKDKPDFRMILSCANELLARKSETQEQQRNRVALEFAEKMKEKGEW